tara:strand:+ start:123 stop:554 length:432 start_codon:yes stop_codon:yes gene_type:complete
MLIISVVKINKMGFKIKPSYNKNDMNIPVYHMNLDDGSVGKSNHGGIVVGMNLDPVMEKAVVKHETVHQLDEDLDYDKDFFYYKDKSYKRGPNLDESKRSLPWEQESYPASDKVLQGYRGNNKMAQNFQKKGLITYNGEEEII